MTPRRTTLAEKKFRLAELARETGKLDEARKWENKATIDGRDMFLQQQVGSVLRKLRNPATRWTESELKGYRE